MIATKTIRFLIVCLLLLGLSVGQTAAQRKKQIAVLDFDFATVDLGLADRAYGGRQNLARRVADKLVTSLVGLGTCQVVERSQLEKVLREQNLGTEGRIDPSTAAKVGRILGVDALVIGNVSVFELKGMPESNDAFWDNKKLSARIAVNFRVVDTTTAVVELSNEQTGMSSAPPKSAASTGASKVGSVLGGMLGGNKSGVGGGSKVKDEEIRDVVQQALDDTIGKITVEVEKYLSGALRPAEPTLTADKQVTGSIIEVNGPSLIITGIRKGAVRMGDRLYVRRSKVRRDPVSNREVRYSEKVGEVEVVEIQDEVLIGSFAGSGAAQVGDAVTNNPTGPITTPASAATVQPPPTQSQPVSAPIQSAAGSSRSVTAVNTPPPQRLNSASQEHSVQVQANLNWNNTGIDVRPGEPLELIATGMVKISPTREVAPTGLINRPAPPTLPLPGANIGALVVRVCFQDGQCSPVQLVGARNRLSPVKAGRLMLGINDSDVADNSGAFTVTVRR
jgi:curli biogenesis system outer membrane secretion channel CsgG